MYVDAVSHSSIWLISFTVNFIQSGTHSLLCVGSLNSGVRLC